MKIFLLDVTNLPGWSFCLMVYGSRQVRYVHYISTGIGREVQCRRPIIDQFTRSLSRQMSLPEEKGSENTDTQLSGFFYPRRV